MGKDFLSSNELNRIEGFIDREEGDRLARYAAHVPADQIIVEIGSASGAGACYLAAGARKGHGARIVCIDPYETIEDNAPNYVLADARALFQARAQYLGVPMSAVPVEEGALFERTDDAITLIIGRSLEVAECYRDTLNPPPIGLVHIDGLHEFHHARADYEAWGPLVARGGHVIFHDLLNRSHGWDVLGVVENVVKPSRLFAEVEAAKWSRYKGRRRGQWIGVRA